jgi:prevent-host-death family protein
MVHSPKRRRNHGRNGAEAERVVAPEYTIAISEFKRRCLELLDRIHRRGEEIVVTKRGDPIARVSPLRPHGASLRASMRGRLTVHGDIVHGDFSRDWESAR